MPPKNNQPQSYQPSFESLKPTIDLSSRNAFGRSVSLAYYDISPETLINVTETDLSHVEIDNIRDALYTGGGRFQINGLNFNEEEYSTIVRNPKYFGRAVIAKTFSARGLDNNSDRRTETAERSALHAFSSKEEAMTNMLQGLEQEHVWLSKLHKEMKGPKYAHYRESEMRTLATSTWHISFINMLNVTASKMEWDDETHELAEKALTVRLLTGPQRSKVGYWQQLTSLGIRYNHHKQLIIGNRLTEVQSKIK